MRLITKNMNGNMHEAASQINDQHSARFLLQIDYKSGNYSTALFRVDSYPDYLQFCKLWYDKPVTAAEFFK